MTNYKGKNDNKSVIAKTHYRAKYSSQAFRESNIRGDGQHESIVDFNFSEMRYYGKIDDEADPVVVRPSLMKPLSSGGGLGGGAQQGTVKLLVPPLRDMFQYFQRKFSQAVRQGKISEDDPYLASPSIVNDFVDPIREYKVYLSSIMDAFNQEFLKEPARQNDIVKFPDYVRHLMDYLNMMGSDYPVTLTGWRKSRKSSIMSTGLAISISDLDCGVDSDKEEFILNKNCTKFYYQACKQYGFSVSKQCPWVIVGDLVSPGSAFAMRNHRIFGPRLFFQTYYTKTYTRDLELLMPFIRKSYLDFITINRYHKQVDICSKDVNKLIYKNIYKETITKEEYNQQYGIYYWIPYYIKIRNIEDEHPYDQPSITRITQKASEFEKLLDKDKAMGYINEQFRKKYRYADGSYLYYKKRMEGRQDQSDQEG